MLSSLSQSCRKERRVSLGEVGKEHGNLGRKGAPVGGEKAPFDLLINHTLKG